MKPFLTIKELHTLLQKGEITSQEILNFYHRRFAAYDDRIGSALEIFDVDSIVKAGKSGENAEPLRGIPGLVKDNICQMGRVTSCGSKMLKNYVAPYDATAISRLKKVGSFLIGRANMDEFAMGSSTETSAFQKTKNPWDTSRVPGGSSGGSIAAVAAGLVPFALGSETGGSVRQPAAFCGIVGFKPTYGLISRYGLIAYASSIDQIGIATRTVYDNALVLSAIAGEDARDATTLKGDRKNYAKNLTGVLPKNLTIGVVEDAIHANGMDKQIVQAIEIAIKELQKLGATIKPIALPALQYSAAAYFIISRAEAASNLARFDGIRYGWRSHHAKTLRDVYTKSRAEGFGAEVKARIMIGNFTLSAGHADEFYQNAQNIQREIQAEFLAAFNQVNLLIMPTHPISAFPFDAFAHDKLQMDLQDYFTCGINLAHIPAISIPCGFTGENLPIGMQFVGPGCSEELLYQVGDAYQRVTDWHQRHPDGFE